MLNNSYLRLSAELLACITALELHAMELPKLVTEVQREKWQELRINLLSKIAEQIFKEWTVTT